jgi:hypothetical protein
MIGEILENLQHSMWLTPESLSYTLYNKCIGLISLSVSMTMSLLFISIILLVEQDLTFRTVFRVTYNVLPVSTGSLYMYK